MRMIPHEPFHEGEIAIQERTGERAGAVRNGTIIRDALTPPVREFIGLQRTIAVAALDAGGRPWASLWIGPPGFVRSEHERSVEISRRLHLRSSGDPLPSLLRERCEIGILVIDLGSRRRLRVNGIVAADREDLLTVAIHEAFPNCPKYIQRRDVEIDSGARHVGPASSRGTSLSSELRSLVERIDTLFVASRHPTHGLDVSHRGGDPGFVKVVDERTLRFPDYAGNSMFMTLGNLSVDPRCGVVLLDFECGGVLSLTGNATIDFGAEDPGHPTGGTGRYWTLDVAEWHRFSLPDGVAFRFVERSPFLPPPVDRR
jgi:predicted pyridoxine 5'-phosphate oxidase superfamily flavin-nucleotide-binding protein